MEKHTFKRIHDIVDRTLDVYLEQHGLLKNVDKLSSITGCTDKRFLSDICVIYDAFNEKHQMYVLRLLHHMGIYRGSKEYDEIVISMTWNHNMMLIFALWGIEDKIKAGDTGKIDKIFMLVDTMHERYFEDYVKVDQLPNKGILYAMESK